ncbi:MAG: phage tail protein I [Oscillospiraceae bacterium]|nr:phage tail protein I [Oscillospiraceae bacterium]
MREIQNISLLELLPPSISHDPDVRAAAESIDAELRKTTGLIPDLAIISRLLNREIDDPDLLDLLAWGLHADFYSPEFPIAVKQELVAKSLDWHTRKGTLSVVDEIVSAVFDRSDVTEWYEYGGMPYRFKIGVGFEDLSVQTLQYVIDAVFSVKHTRSWLDNIEILRVAEGMTHTGAGVYQKVTMRVPAEISVGWGEWGWGNIGWGGTFPEGSE